ncbi:hypothetical protein CL619_05110 [archaeon]|nr:hypothetical protein [archaeon]|tara:strand:+ start:36 stop:365 length:330 start_codon:yes stop_codon:yes gene_type:complete
MNIILPLILLVIANLVLYWIFFGKARFERKLHSQIVAAQAAGKKISSEEERQILQMTGSKISNIFGNNDQRFSNDKLVISKKEKNPKAKIKSVKKPSEKSTKKSGVNKK